MKKTMKRVIPVLCVALLALGVVLSCASSGGGGGGGKSGSLLEGTPSEPTGDWLSYDDTPDGGSSTSEITSAQETLGGETATVYTIKGNVTTKFQYGFCGWKLDPDDQSLALLKSAKGFSFKVLGDGKAYAVKYKTSDCSSDSCFFEYVFNTKEGEVATIEVPMKLFMQPSWGAPKSLRQANFIGMEWQTHERWRKPGDENPFEVKFWDFKVYN